MVVEVSLRKLTPSRVALEIEVDSVTVDQAFRDVYRDLSRSARIPGFRKGKAPRELVERTFGEDDIRMRVWKKIAPQAFLDAVQQAGVTPIDLPDFDYTEPQQKQPLTVRASVLVKPEPKLGEYKGLKLKRHVYQPQESDVQEQLERLREGRATYKDTERRDVRKGDLAIVNMSILPEGAEEPVAEEGASMLIGEKRYEPPLDRGDRRLHVDH
jgi:trigger factor